MKTYFILALVLALAFTLSACPPEAKVQTQQLDGRAYTTMSHGDLTLTYVELDKSTAVVFKSAGPLISDSDRICLVCTVGEIGGCAGPGKDSDAINKCTRQKCEAAGKCEAAVARNLSFGLISLQIRSTD